jgi:hypothetical protein
MDRQIEGYRDKQIDRQIDWDNCQDIRVIWKRSIYFPNGSNIHWTDYLKSACNLIHVIILFLFLGDFALTLSCFFLVWDLRVLARWTAACGYNITRPISWCGNSFHGCTWASVCVVIPGVVCVVIPGVVCVVIPGVVCVVLPGVVCIHWASGLYYNWKA